MNFTREPILETIIAAKEGFKLKLKSTKHEGAAEYVVDAVEVVSFGTTFFYRSGEPAHTFFVPAQDFEIVQVRQARLMLKTPVDGAVKIAGGADAGKKSSPDKGPEKKRKKVKPAKAEKRPAVENAEEKKEGSVENLEKKPKAKTQKRSPAKDTKRKAPGTEPVDKEVVQPSMFSHLLRPPEALISDNISQYQSIIDKQNEDKKEKKQEMVNVTSAEVEEKVEALVTPEITSEEPAPQENLSHEVADEKPLTLKEKMKKVLSPAIKEPVKKEETEK